MREIMVSSLIKDLLGPRNGIHEEFDTTYEPINEFTTGILSPAVTNPSAISDEHANQEVLFRTEPSATKEGDEQEEPESAVVNPILNPQKPSQSMGISFQVRANSFPKFKVCLTWARYHHTSKWKRHPKYAVFSIKGDTEKTMYFDSHGKKCTKDNLETETSFRLKIKQSLDSFFVSMFLTNEKTWNREKFDRFSQYNIFQPQIRIVFEDGTEKVEMKDRSHDPDMQMTELLYKDRKSYARGHMTSAVWKEIDPEIVPENLKKRFPKAVNELGFSWADRETVPDKEAKPFLAPDLRTEYIPMYSVPSPNMGWDNDNEDMPVLSANDLSQMWEPDTLEKSLQPIVRQYEGWIANLSKERNETNSIVIDKIIKECNDVLRRIQDGIKLLVNDPDARLAFCFANRAINLQTQWNKKVDFVYRPFQIAFVLLTLESILHKNSNFRDICDLLWIPTGGGKTEAYLILVAICMAYRRLKSVKNERTGAGVSVFTRYTLRLLTIQQFRRSLSVFSAAEVLRVEGTDSEKCIGWRPDSHPDTDSMIWGSTPFSVGLWVGDGVTPNKLETAFFESQNTAWKKQKKGGALEQLKQENDYLDNNFSGEPAQILNCPACQNILAIPGNMSANKFEQGLDSNTPHTVTWIVKSNSKLDLLQSKMNEFKSNTSMMVENAEFQSLQNGYFSLRIKFKNRNQKISSSVLIGFWQHVQKHLGLDKDSLQSTSAARPGYFFKKYKMKKGKLKEYDFEIFCTSDTCPLRKRWFAGSPMGEVNGSDVDNYMLTDSSEGIILKDGNMLIQVQKCFCVKDFVSDRIPIPGTTVDDQVYKNLPTMVVATVDKFARLPFEPKAAGLFGNVEYHHMLYGYYRITDEGDSGNKHPSYSGTKTGRNYKALNRIEIPKPPDFVIQDELHLIDGPLGSIVGLYESCVDFLSSSKFKLKYIASTATIKKGEEQIKSLFSRKLQIFPPKGVSVDDRFFVREREDHQLDDSMPGRLYLGVMAPGKGALTPIVRMWASLAQTAYVHRENSEIDRFWTLVGYFNAIRELGGGLSVYHQAIPSRILEIATMNSDIKARPLDQNTIFELSGRTPSDALPSILDGVNKKYDLNSEQTESPDALFTTSMFGTGVDISRLGLMLVNGQPKTTSSYIQSTGRVGRAKGGLVVVFYRATRSRDLSHYEYFMRYHRQLHRTVESPTVYPFSPGAVNRALGPIVVGMLRNMREPAAGWQKKKSAAGWQKKKSAAEMADCDFSTNPEFETIAKFLEERGQSQPEKRTPEHGTIYQEVKRCISVWSSIAQNANLLEYYAINKPYTPVVLGDMIHECQDAEQTVFRLAPQSMRTIEGETKFGVKQ